MRAFVAFPIPDHVRVHLEDGIAILRKANPQIRWIPPKNLHITVAFLGEVSDSQAQLTSDIIDHIAISTSSLQAAVQQVGTFPPKGKPRVIFANLVEGLTEMSNLRTITMEKLSRISPVDRRPFKPHITLARCRRGSPLFQEVDDVYSETVQFTIDRIVLYESILAPGGPRYIPRHEARLKNDKDCA